MKKTKYIYLLVFISLYFTSYAQEDTISKFEGSLILSKAEINKDTGEQLYYTVCKVELTENIDINKVSSSTILKEGNSWREYYSFYTSAQESSTSLKKFYIEDNTLIFELGLIPLDYKIKIKIYDQDENLYGVKINKTEHIN
ncbi:MAG: hypothetical protein KAH72_00545 [Flavobacteriaceae bacterium]|nr:hypothetical protein [Flavobacteriaceae bacterium]